MITPTVKTGQPLRVGTNVGVKRFIFVRSTKYQEQSRKYGRNAIEINRASLPVAGLLGEIGDSGTISVYFTCLRQAGGVYFYDIPLYYFTKRSEVCFFHISILFPFDYFTERSEVYFNPISIVFPFDYFTERS